MASRASRKRYNTDSLLASFRALRNSGWSLASLKLPYADPTSEEALSPCKRWLAECLQEHTECATPYDIGHPIRVLNVGTETVTLQEIEKLSLPSPLRYACLSHCWGPNGPAITLTKETATALRKGIPIEDLPRTFAEACKVCLTLGIDYLWIDSLCKSRFDPGLGNSDTLKQASFRTIWQTGKLLWLLW